MRPQAARINVPLSAAAFVRWPLGYALVTAPEQFRSALSQHGDEREAIKTWKGQAVLRLRKAEGSDAHEKGAAWQRELKAARGVRGRVIRPRLHPDVCVAKRFRGMGAEDDALHARGARGELPGKAGARRADATRRRRCPR